MQVGPVQVGPVQVGPVQVGPVQVGPVQVGPVQVGPMSTPTGPAADLEELDDAGTRQQREPPLPACRKGRRGLSSRSLVPEGGPPAGGGVTLVRHRVQV
jgi:hypothetical protein